MIACGFCEGGYIEIRSRFGHQGTRIVECPYCDGTGVVQPLNHPQPNRK